MSMVGNAEIKCPEIKGPNHAFWSTQPVSINGGHQLQYLLDGPVQDCTTVSRTPGQLPDNLEWCEIDIKDSIQRQSLYLLLNQNYVEDTDSIFRFDYPTHFLEWAFQPPGAFSSWNIAIRSIDKQELLAFINAIPCRLHVKGNVVEMAEVNFLCVHKKLRTKRLAPTLIREITRRVNLCGIFQAFYTAGVKLPGLLCSARYFHRPLNFSNLLKSGFAELPTNMKLQEAEEFFSLSPKVNGNYSFRQMTADDIFRVKSLLDSFFEKFAIHPVLPEEDIRHWLLPKSGILFSYVMTNELGEIVAFSSFYSLPSTVTKSNPVMHIRAAYLFYFAAISDDLLNPLLHFTLLKAKEAEFDVFNCLKTTNCHLFIKQLKFEEGDGFLNYYIYNWRTLAIPPSEIFLPMI